MSENHAALMAVIRSEFKKLRDEASAATTPASLPSNLEDRLSAIERGQQEILAELRRSAGVVARAVGIIHAELPNSEPLPPDLLRDEVFRSFMEHYPETAKPAYDVAKFQAMSREMESWSDELLAERKAKKAGELADGKLDPLDAYKAGVVLARINQEEQRRNDRSISRNGDGDRGR